MFGLKPEDCQQTVELWECNVQSFAVFEAMGTQWRTGMSGATGLDYQTLPVVMGLLDVEQDQHQAIFADIRVMEQAALRTMADSREE
ncbi:DUF1799 domain-containing protein [Pseudomonas guariconensis]|nr:DUF1799 domain-containing protein [Pseudomonas guariconensis]MDM9594743.1 DUF1799 domain-containing protein [Pseudomonas guariconensis]MDM9607574.1 DUF1799 domain-containing protein [Pseudomonas guariconensis]MDM9612531.1 DUF1799 domain-containing protein [Pseudomonas guariconensis]